MTKLKIVGKVAVLVLLFGAVAAAPLFLNGVDGGIQVGSANSIADYPDDPNDPYDYTLNVFSRDPLSNMKNTNFEIAYQLNNG